MADAASFARRSALPTLNLNRALLALRARDEWKVVRVLWAASPALAGVWWTVLVLRGALPAILGIAMGTLVDAVQRGADLTSPLAFAAVVFMLLQVLAPIQQAVSGNLGDLVA